MKLVTVTIKLEFEAEEVDQETLKEAVHSILEEKIEEDEIMDTAKIKMKDIEEEDEDYEDDEDEE